ncbi:Tex family protein [Weissella confusa]|uniref:RNA-binding transcriptional accessory protein n=1 Tax=Weissella confusa TaxID=1583 RepID=A0A4Z0RKF5_WEICO|nr:Tex family protein [Weissella confusa]MBJ7633367.1 RNA-binding transcriptional accessory protein [Weissella confusa]MBJ7639791.1 RNA-binding transcriptional accessory protein [Weissella confusa]MBJ7646193.1 RNA-binding transcriptional accessory protein [Weissella confusa]MBJ7669836.1 RNA-binding transcriptional accessory protein [Weissella confusa]MDA5458629.1 Transcription accessory protein (S1 RNA-binding) [Weissella confusa]
MTTAVDDALKIDIVGEVAKELALPLNKVTATADLLADGNTVPFIARYRKDVTGNLDEVQIRDIQAATKRLEDLQARKATVEKAITEQKAMTPNLMKALVAADTMQAVEDLYLPYKQKRRTKATIAKEAGLMPMAQFVQKFPAVGLQAEAAKFVDADKDLPDVAAVMAGVHEIFAEVIGENAGLRDWVRKYTRDHGRLVSKQKRGAGDKDEQGIFQLYYDFSMPMNKVANHQILAINRGENEGVLSGSIDVDVAAIERYLKFRLVGSKTGESADVLTAAANDAYKRFIGPAIERELRKELFDRAAGDAIKVFGTNLYHLLMAAPLRGRVVLGYDPGVRTGSKLAVVDENGKFLEKAHIYPLRGMQYDPKGAKQTIINLVKKYGVSLVAIGNGTASRESQSFVADIIKSDLPDLQYVVVNESGASVYSASDMARAEFPDLQVEQRSAISIARRLQDPMAELIKIDPQAVGVGQYQHDLPTKELETELDAVLETAVNQVGVNLNTASPQLLTHIAGLTKTTAANIVAYRDENGQFTSRAQLKKVPKLGPKAFEQAAGFLRLPDGKNALDNTDIHPESYKIAEALLAEAGVTALGEVAQKPLARLNNQATADRFGIGLATLQDIIASLGNPGRDLRDDAPGAVLRSDVLSLKDLKPGMQLQGTVRNVVDFGAFVDLGVHEDGLVHISRMAKRRVTNPHEIVAVGDIITVWVVDVDVKRERIGLTMIEPTEK